MLCTMPSIPFQAFVLAMCLFVATSSGTPSPTGSAHAAGTCAAAKNMSNNQIFGVPEAKLAKATAASQAVQELRGGELHEPETLQDTEALVLTAATNRQLLVIDFTASWW
jgi:hypothetical protein